MIMSLSYQFIGRHAVFVLRAYFITRVSLQLYDLYLNHTTNETINELIIDKGWTFEQASLRYLLLRACESILPLFSLASCIAILSKLFHQALLKFMMVEDAESASSAGTLAGCLFIIICFQCGITSLPDEERYWRILRNLGLIVIVNLHSLFKPVSDRLQSLSASRSKTVHKHLRVLLVSLASILLPIIFLTYLWFNSSINSWTMAVAVFGFELIFRMTISLIIYTMCMIYSFCDVTWRGLEDQIYYLKASCGMISYLCGISLFCNGTWVYFFENSTTLRAISLGIHLYFNIWNQAWKGWNVFNKRRMASAKINHLRDASEKELLALDDVCSICFHQLDQAKVTNCNHYFHADCLTRWLYLQDTCPICCSTRSAPRF